MKTITLEIYSVEELNPAALEKAYEKWLDRHEYHCYSENYCSLSEFEKHLPIRIREVDGSFDNLNVRWSFTEREEVEELTGMRLHKYILNNYYQMLYKACYIRTMKSDQPLKHRYIKTRKSASGHYYNTWYSLMRPTRDCNLTGFYMDEVILDPLYKFINNPDNTTTFGQLIGDCIHEWERAVAKDYEGCTSMEYFMEEMEANDVYFTEDGSVY